MKINIGKSGSLTVEFCDSSSIAKTISDDGDTVSPTQKHIKYNLIMVCK